MCTYNRHGGFEFRERGVRGLLIAELIDTQGLLHSMQSCGIPATAYNEAYPPRRTLLGLDMHLRGLSKRSKRIAIPVSSL